MNTYIDAKYKYSFMPNGLLYSMIKLTSNENIPKVSLSKERAIDKAEILLQKIMPEVKIGELIMNIIPIEGSAEPWRIELYKTEAETKAIIGYIAVFIDDTGDISCLMRKGSFSDETVLRADLISEEKAIDSAYTAAALLAEEIEKQSMNTSTNENQKDAYSETIITDNNKEIKITDGIHEKPIIYDLGNRNSQKVNSSLSYNEGKYIWSIVIRDVKDINSKISKSFYITVDAQTGKALSATTCK